MQREADEATEEEEFENESVPPGGVNEPINPDGNDDGDEDDPNGTDGVREPPELEDEREEGEPDG